MFEHAAGVTARQFQLLVEAVSDYAIFLLDPDGRVASWNAGATRIKGYHAEEIIGEHVSRFYTDADTIGGMPTRELALATSSGRRQSEGWRVRKDGTTFWASVTLTALRNDDGSLTGYAKVTHDLTDRKVREDALLQQRDELTARAVTTAMRMSQVSDALKQSELRANTVLDAIATLRWVWNENTKELNATPPWHVYTGMNRQDVAGPDWLRALHPEDVDDTARRYQHAMDNTEPFNAVYRAHRADGEYRVLRAEGYPLRTPQGEVIEWVGFCIDITEQRNVEHQLRQAQKMEAIGTLAGGIAHDFNNLLTVILGYGVIAQLGAERGDVRVEPILAIQSAAERAAELTRQLLAYSRRTPLVPQVFALNAVVRDTDAMLRRIIGDDIQVSLVLDPVVDCIRADPAQIVQVLMNLVANARDAMPEGGMLHIETQADVSAGATLISVQDSGSGMTPEILARAFDPFFTTKEVGKGSGLGLSMVQGIVAQSGGTVRVESTPGRGTRFEVSLPTVQPLAPPSSEAAKPAQTAAGNETVLVVEDEPDLRSLLVVSLLDAGYSVLSAADGCEALRVLAAHGEHIDALVSDVAMPGMSGVQLARQIQLRSPATRVLLISGYTADVIAADTNERPLAFLQKPFTPARLCQRLRTLLDEPTIHERTA